MNHRAFEAIKDHHMIEQGDRICVALSGGADSVALLAFLRENQSALGIDLCACHLNHRLRGEESDRDEGFVRGLCDRWEIPLTVRSQPIGELSTQRGLSLEECGRQERYRLFGELSQATGCKVATAHTRSDSMETLLFNLTRGTGLRGMGGIAPVRGRIIRPLISCTRQDIEDYCRQRGLEYVTDSTNLTDEYTRNRIRHQVIPTLYGINPAAHEAFGNLMELASQAEALIRRLAREALTQVRLEEGYSASALLNLDPLVAQALLSELCTGCGVTLTHRHTRICRDLLRIGGAVELGNGVIFSVRGGRFWVRREAALEKVADFTLSLGAPIPESGEISLCELHKTLRWETVDCEQKKNFGSTCKFFLKNTLDCDRIYGIVILRPRRAGDSLRIPGRGCTKNLKKLFQEAGVPPAERGRCLVLSDERGVLWVEGFGSDERVVPGVESRRILTLQIHGQIQESVEDTLSYSNGFVARKEYKK